MRRIQHSILILLVLTGFCPNAFADGGLLSLTTPRGAPITVLPEKPAGSGPFPAVILGSGSGYPMQGPILAKVSDSLVKAGFAVFRFNWAYYVKDPVNGKQSKDRQAEIEDFNTVLGYARQQPWVDKTRLIVGGKSLGSIIAWRVLRTTPDLEAALLLTPVCSAGKPAIAPADNYPDVGTETRPTAWILGDTDSACAPAVLYGFLAKAGGPARVDVVAGNHSLESGKSPEADAGNADRLDTLSKLAVDFAEAVLARSAIP